MRSAALYVCRAPTLNSERDGQGRQPRAGQRRPAQQAPAEAFQDGPGPRRRRIHGRRLRDRRAARARPPLRQPDGQRVRRLRRHLGGLVRRVARGERHHARGDDAGRQQPGAEPVPRRLPRDISCGRTSSSSRRRASRCRGRRRRCCARWPATSVRSPRSTSSSASPRACRLALYSGSGHRALPAHRALRPGPHERLPRTRPASSTSPRPTSTHASASCSAPRSGATSRSPRP